MDATDRQFDGAECMALVNEAEFIRCGEPATHTVAILGLPDGFTVFACAFHHACATEQVSA